MREKKNKESIINVRDLIFVFYILYSRLISGGSTEVDDFTEMLRLMDVKFADEEDEGHADGQLPDVPAQAVQEVHDQNDVAAATTPQPRSASQASDPDRNQTL